MKHLLLCGGLMFGLVACNRAAEPAPNTSNASSASTAASPSAPLSFTLAKTQKKFGECKTEEENCFKVVVEYPVAVGKNAAAFNTVVDTLVAHHFQFGDEEPPKTLAEGLASYEKGFKASLKEIPDAPNSWFKELKGELVHQAENWVTMRFEDAEYTGGAHPNTFVQFINLDGNGKLIDVRARITDNAKLLALAEAAFRKERGFPATGSLNDQGMQFEKDRFVLPAELALGKEGLIFFYNAYEVGPYAAGPTEFSLPLADLKGVINL